MCGLAGFIDSSLTEVEQKETIRSMLDSIKHRGPDNSGFKVSGDVVLGHNRLSIIDLSVNANQPMVFQHLWMVYNGEVYNYLEIRRELEDNGYIFDTTSDTEVILKSYHKWGSSCVDKFIGMWAFVIWDVNDKHLFCSRDRFGIKPFFYIFQN